MKSTAILGILKGWYFVFEAWNTDSSDQAFLLSHVNRLSQNHPTIPIWRYVVLKRPQEKGNSFSLVDYDKKVVCNPLIFLNNEYQGDWSQVSHLDLIAAQKIAKESLGF